MRNKIFELNEILLNNQDLPHVGFDVVVRIGASEDVALWQDFHRRVSNSARRARYNATISIERIIDDECVHVDYGKSIPILAIVNGKIVGISHLAIYNSSSDGYVSFIVAESWKGKKIGSILMESMIEVMLVEGVHKINGETGLFNTGMIHLFKKYRFDLTYDCCCTAVRNVTLDSK